MSTISHEPHRAAEKPLWAREIFVPEMWAALSIVVIWISVLAAAIFGPDIVNTTAGGEHTTLPSAVPVALFAFLATWVIARYGFRRERRDD